MLKRASCKWIRGGRGKGVESCAGKKAGSSRSQISCSTVAKSAATGSKESGIPLAISDAQRTPIKSINQSS